MDNVVISGMSIVTPLGLTKDQIWENLLQNKSGFSKIESFKLNNISSSIGGEIKEFINKNNKYIKILDLLIQNILIDSNLSKKDLKEICFSLGTTFIGIENYSYKKINFFKSYLKNKYGFKEIIFNTNTCAAGNFAINIGANLIKNNVFSKVICGGIDILTPYIFAGFENLRSLSSGEPKPFSKERDGLALGEGGALLLIESLCDTKIRKGKIYCEYGGFGASVDNLGVTGMDKTGGGVIKCFQNLVENSKIEKEQIDLISTHSTATKLNDKIEAESIIKIFPQKPHIQGFKSFWGHSMGASSAIQAAILSLTFEKNILIKIRNLINLEFDLNYVTENIEKKINFGMINAFGFGGINSSLLLKRYNE
ncbi:MAG: hypothetical protein A2086_03650 [Spirochaetes bacterium GWD1_27_9]|nr:MAG: hypothetical protein A2Z98_10325 [Spirochaetes bacterium GWB1_27_13]OHD25456.1 MAG: hypothetical protein A2Y34_17725 [Spirochaetes bacterium GWC1_27_15]OHD44385.1 MAG: hypothetical protein A2086_03650 [Spirochaetes bacterium GWD1_27_9]